MSKAVCSVSVLDGWEFRFTKITNERKKFVNLVVMYTPGDNY